MNKKKKSKKFILYEKFKREKNPELYIKNEEQKLKCHRIKVSKLLFGLIRTEMTIILICLAAIGAVALVDEQIRHLLIALLD